MTWQFLLSHFLETNLRMHIKYIGNLSCSCDIRSFQATKKTIHGVFLSVSGGTSIQPGPKNRQEVTLETGWKS